MNKKFSLPSSKSKGKLPSFPPEESKPDKKLTVEYADTYYEVAMQTKHTYIVYASGKRLELPKQSCKIVT